MAEKEYSSDLRVINVGLQFFYDALVSQNVKATQLQWRPPFKVSAETTSSLNRISNPEIKAKIEAANESAVNRIINSDPYWIDVRPAGEVIEGLDDYTVIHSGPPIDYDHMVMLHQRGLVSACLFEGWAKNDYLLFGKEAKQKTDVAVLNVAVIFLVLAFALNVFLLATIFGVCLFTVPSTAVKLAL